MLRGLKRRGRGQCVGHGLYLALKACYIFGPSGAMSMVHCHSLACRSEGHFITHMFWWSAPWTKGRQRVVVLALVHLFECTRFYLNRIFFRISETGQAKIHILRRFAVEVLRGHKGHDFVLTEVIGPVSCTGLLHGQALLSGTYGRVGWLRGSDDVIGSCPR
jgi:hypothetical protein